MKVSIINYENQELRADFDDFCEKLVAYEHRIVSYEDNEWMKERQEAEIHARAELIQDNIDLIINFIEATSHEDYTSVLTKDIPVIDFDMRRFTDESFEYITTIGEVGAYIMISGAPDGGFSLTRLMAPVEESNDPFTYLNLGELFEQCIKAKRLMEIRDKVGSLPDGLDLDDLSNAIPVPKAIGDILLKVLSRLDPDLADAMDHLHDCANCDGIDDCDLPPKHEYLKNQKPDDDMLH